MCLEKVINETRTFITIMGAIGISVGSILLITVIVAFFLCCKRKQQNKI